MIDIILYGVLPSIGVILLTVCVCIKDILISYYHSVVPE